MKQKLIKILMVFILVFTLTMGIKVYAEEEVTEEEEVTTPTTEEPIEEEKGFLEQYWGVLVASSGGTLAALGVVVYWLLKALKKSKEMIDSFKEDNKISSANAKDLTDICDMLEELINVKVNAMFENLNASQEEIKALKEQFNGIVANLEANQNDTMEILKTALLNDSSLVKNGVANILKEQIEEYEQRNNEQSKEEK